MNKKLMEILTWFYERHPGVTPKQAHDKIVELWKECLPKKAKHGIRDGEYENGFVDGINEAITQAQKNMEG